MDKFWEWMEENGYATDETYDKSWCLSDEPNSEGAFKPKKQMLIGYMIEYLIENHKALTTLNLIEKDINVLYDLLVQEIEELE
jgi:hypothetical protein